MSAEISPAFIWSMELISVLMLVTWCTSLPYIHFSRARNIQINKNCDSLKFTPKKWLNSILAKDGTSYGTIQLNSRDVFPMKINIYKWQLTRQESLQDFQVDSSAPPSTHQSKTKWASPSSPNVLESHSKFKTISSILKEKNTKRPRDNMVKIFMR